jgi:Ca-activated chloride channel family protein
MQHLSLYLSFYCLLFISLVSHNKAIAQDNSAPIIFIYDASGSMWGKMSGSTKVEIAREVLSNTIDELSPAQRIGFVAYGHRQKGDCEDVEYLIDYSNESKTAVKEQLNKIQPLGKTPLAYSALTVINRLKGASEQAMIILITDGIESCGGDLCQVIQDAREAGVNFRMHIVGFGLEEENLDNLKCAAQAGNGNYYDAGDADELSAVLEAATAQTIDDAVFSLAVFTTKNDQPIDSWIKAYLSGTDEEAGGVRTYRDTGFVALQAGTYDILVQPLENSDVSAQTIEGVEIKEGEITFQAVSFDAGKMEVSITMNDEGWDASVKIKDTKTGKTVSGGRTYGRSALYDVSPGVYDIEATALKINGLETVVAIEGVEVKPNETITVSHNFPTGIARIGALGTSGLMDATINIVEKSSNRSVGGGRTYTSDSSNPKEFLLTPGDYTVTLVSVREFKGEKRSFDMSIKAGETFEKILQF